MDATYNVTEVFRSVQGEGPEAGVDAVFVRFAGCNLHCPFCDEHAHASGREMTADDIRRHVLECGDGEPFAPERIILTGGEPLLQVDDRLMRMFSRSFPGAGVSIETNGSLAIDGNPDLELILEKAEVVVVSPKGTQDTLARGLFKKYGHGMPRLCFKVLVPLQGGITINNLLDIARFSETGLLYLQPVTPRNWIGPDGRAEFLANAAEAIRLQRELALACHRSVDPAVSFWRVAPQMHVWMDVR